MIHLCFRGELYYADLGHGMGSEQQGCRPVLILQNDSGNVYSVIDKGRLERRIGMLSGKDMKEIDRAIKVSVGLIVLAQRIPLCLCSTCAGKLTDTGAFYLQKSKQFQSKRKLCRFCNCRIGSDYEMIRKKN